MNLYNFYFEKSRKWMKNATVANTLAFKITSKITQIYLNDLYIKKLQKRCNVLQPQKNSDKQLIVSLTSFPARINTVWITIETIFQQEQKPDRIILWLANEQFPDGEKKLPENLKKQISRGLEIRFVTDLKSHKKYYFAMQENPEAIIITIDDDVFYPKDTIKNLIELHSQHPHDIIAHCAQEIPDDWRTVPSQWRTPHFNHVNDIFAKLRILGIGGVLYPPHSLYEDVFDYKLCNKLCPWADDLWLTIMAYLAGTQIRRYEFRSNPLDIRNTQKYNLSRGGTMSYNVTHGLSNDDQWKRLLDFYNHRLTDIINKKRNLL